MKLYTVLVYNQRMCMKEDNLDLKYFKGDNSREVISISDFLSPNLPIVVLLLQQRTTMILLCEDGSLRIYMANVDKTNYWLSPSLQPQSPISVLKPTKKKKTTRSGIGYFLIVLYTNSDQTLMNALHGLLNCEIRGTDCSVITSTSHVSIVYSFNIFVMH